MTYSVSLLGVRSLITPERINSREKKHTPLQSVPNSNTQCEPVWPNGETDARLAKRQTQIRIGFGSPCSSPVLDLDLDK